MSNEANKDVIFEISSDMPKVRIIQITKGTKILVDYDTLEKFKSKQSIQDNFTLNIKQCDDMWSIYFDNRRDVPFEYFG
jgi:hypothetical protein